MKKIRITADGRRLQSAKLSERTLPAVQPNAGIRVAYQRALEALIDRMTKSVSRELEKAYAANTPEIAMDASPAAELRDLIARLGRKWQAEFDKLAPEMAAYFAKSAADRSGDGVGCRTGVQINRPASGCLDRRLRILSAYRRTGEEKAERFDGHRCTSVSAQMDQSRDIRSRFQVFGHGGHSERSPSKALQTNPTTTTRAMMQAKANMSWRITPPPS